MREINLTKKEQVIFEKTKIKNGEIEKLIKDFSVKKIKDVNYVLHKVERSIGCEANFMNTGLALSGILQEGETLHDFIEFKLKFSEICNIRAEILYKQYRNEKWRNEKWRNKK